MNVLYWDPFGCKGETDLVFGFSTIKTPDLQWNLLKHEIAHLCPVSSIFQGRHPDLSFLVDKRAHSLAWLNVYGQ